MWRFSLEDPRTGQRRGFANLEAMMAASEQEISGSQINCKRDLEGV